jgi:hypothetical protein
VARHKPKTNSADESRDHCQTPAYALQPLLPYLPRGWVWWESAAGEGLLVDALRECGFKVMASDILTGYDFFDYQPAYFDGQITNPPYRQKYHWLARSYAINKPFALLVPGDVLFAKTAQELFKEHGFEAILMDGRVDFKMPEKGWKGKGAQFSVIWLTWGLNIGQQITFAHLPKPSKQRRDEMALGIKQIELFEKEWK